MLANFLAEPAWTALALSLKVASWATLIDLLLGVGFGYLLARKRFPGRELLDAVLTLPMVMPPTVLGYYLLVLIGRHGPVGTGHEIGIGMRHRRHIVARAAGETGRRQAAAAGGVPVALLTPDP